MVEEDELVGRAAELAVTAAALREVAAGRTAALAIEGEAGIGKMPFEVAQARRAQGHASPVGWLEHNTRSHGDDAARRRRVSRRLRHDPVAEEAMAHSAHLGPGPVSGAASPGRG